MLEFCETDEEKFGSWEGFEDCLYWVLKMWSDRKREECKEGQSGLEETLKGVGEWMLRRIYFWNE